MGLINYAMPLFIFISGYLFPFLWRKGKYQDFWNLVKNKAKRILLPYFTKNKSWKIFNWLRIIYYENDIIGIWDTTGSYKDGTVGQEISAVFQRF